MSLTLTQLLKAMLGHRASDVHITSGSPPTFRVNGKIIRVKERPLTPAETKELCYSVLTDHQKAMFEETRELDFSFGVQDLARFRANIFYQRGSVAAAFRHIPFQIPTMDSLGVSPILGQLLHRPKGLILVTGATGSGKTTTLAAMVEELNRTERLHIVTIEDPIEYIFSHKHSIINQREVGHDTKSFASALKAALREDPDVVVVGEMRDPETIETALTLAETGHLVISSVHTNTAYQTITRIVQGVPAQHQDQIRMQLSLVLEGITTQALIRRADKKGRILASEILIPTSSIRNLIRENKLHQILSAMQMGQEASGMVTMNQSLATLVMNGSITADSAVEASPEPESLIKELRDAQRRAS